MRFVDEARIHVLAGSGGNGAVAYRREAFVPRGGPTGGNGGRGGDVVLVASDRVATLLDVKGHQRYSAEHGRAGGPNLMAGRTGKSLKLLLPVGTLVYDEETGELLADLIEAGQRYLAVEGGRGGRGNASFKTATRRTPDFATPGKPGRERRLRLELKVLADVGLLGMPNAGKSSLVRSLSASRAQVADYPFTTLVPNLGVVRSGMLGSFVIADIPGLIPGAHEGAGLGHRFLRHVERTRLLVHVISASPDRDPKSDYEAINEELSLYSDELGGRSQIIVLNKIDLVPRKERDDLLETFRRFAEELGYPFAGISCVTGEGIKAFHRLLEESLVEAHGTEEQPPFDPMDV